MGVGSWNKMSLSTCHRTTYQSFLLGFVEHCQVVLDMAARNNVPTSPSTLLIWPHLLVWELLVGPAETENVFWQLTNETLTLGHRSLLIGCTPSILWLSGLSFWSLAALSQYYCVFGLCATLCNDHSFYAKVGCWDGCNLLMCNCENKNKTTSAATVFLPTCLPLSFFQSSRLIFLYPTATTTTTKHHIRPGFILLTAPCCLFSPALPPPPLSLHTNCLSFVCLFQQELYVLSQHD